MNIQVTDDKNKVIYVTTSPVQAWAYIVARDFGERKHKEATECADLAQYIWLKDNNTIPIGHLVDVTAKKLEYLRKIEGKWELINYVSNCDLDYEEEDDE